MRSTIGVHPSSVYNPVRGKRRWTSTREVEIDQETAGRRYVPDFDSDSSGAVAAGVDVIEIARIQRAIDDFGERFLRRVYTERERDRFRGRVSELAVRFAAKEATSKVLGTGIRGIRWREMEILPNRRGKPVLILHGQAAERADLLGLTDFSVTLTHSRTDAIAFVVGVRARDRSIETVV